jgi:hemoglobin/transferrin/lactoferrin receptor protein
MSHTTSRSTLAVLLLRSAAALAPAFAQEQVAANETVTVSATRHAEAISDVPATVSVISSQQIQDNFVTNIKDLIQYEPGVSVRSQPARFTAAGASTGRDGNSGFNIRGLEGNRVLMINDGIRVPDSFSFGAESMGRGDYLDVDTLKSVEILRGPASALYGSDGIAGAVSFITKDPEDYLKGRDHALQATPSWRSADKSGSGNVTGAYGEGPWSAMVSYTYRNGHALDNMGTNDAKNTDRTTPNPQDIVSNSVLAKAVYRLDDASRLRLTYDYFDSVMDANVYSAIAKPPLASSSVLGLTARDTSKRSRTSLDYAYAGASTDLVQEATAAAYYQKSWTYQYSNEDRNTAVDRTRINTFNNEVWGFTGQANSAFTTGWASHLLIAGVDVSFSRQEGIRDGTVPPVGETFPTRAFPNTDYTLAGGFIQDEIVIGDLKLYPALRLDYYSLDPKPDALLATFTPASQSKSHLSPKFGALYAVTPQIKLFANYAQGFRAPEPSEVNNAFANLIANYRSVPNPNLKAETSETVEGGVRYDSDILSLSGTLFTGQYRDFIDQVQVSGTFSPTDPGIFQYINLGSVHINGAEAKGTINWGAGFETIVAVSYAHGNSVDAGVREPLDSIDPVKVVGGIGYRDPAGLWGGRVTITHSEGKDASRVSSTLCTGACYRPAAFTIMDATAFWNINENFTARAGVFNLFDTRYAWWSDVRGLAASSTVIDAYTQPGRNFGLSLTARL